MKLFLRSLQQPFFIFLFFAFLAMGILSPLASNKYIPDLADFLNHLAAVIQAKMALSEGQFPLRVAPLEHLGWRYAYYQFYSPTTYTVAGLIYQWITPSNPLTACKITLWCALLTGGIYMYRLAYWLVESRLAAIIGSVLYLTSPYVIISVDRLGNLSETLGLGILPAVVYYTIQRYYFPTRAALLLQVSLGWYLLMTTHLVTFVYTSFFVALLLLLVTYKNINLWKNLVSVGIAYALACLLGMWFLMPVGLYAKYLMMGSTFAYSDFFANFSPSLLPHLFSPTATITEGISNSIMYTTHAAVGWPILIAGGLCLYAIINQLSSGNQHADDWLPILFILFIIAFIMVWSPIDFWGWVPRILRIGQYSWRILSQVTWLGTLLFVWAICWLAKNQLDLRQAILWILVIVAIANPWFPSMRYLNVKLPQFIKHPFFNYNEDAYLIDFKGYTKFVNTIDTLVPETLAHDSTLQHNKRYVIARDLLHLAIAPIISLDGHIPAKLNHQQLNVVANGSIITRRELKTGSFHWEIPLTAARTHLKKKSDLSLQFKNTSKISIPLDKVTLSGFMQPAETFSVSKVKQHCKLQKADTLCKLFVPAPIRLLELPILYYPKLLKITVNGEPVPYRSTLYETHLITAITPQSGKMNNIKIQFTGLEWANKISWLGWSLWLVVLLSILVKIRSDTC